MSEEEKKEKKKKKPVNKKKNASPRAVEVLDNSSYSIKPVLETRKHFLKRVKESPNKIQDNKNSRNNR